MDIHFEFGDKVKTRFGHIAFFLGLDYICPEYAVLYRLDGEMHAEPLSGIKKMSTRGRTVKLPDDWEKMWRNGKGK